MAQAVKKAKTEGTAFFEQTLKAVEILRQQEQDVMHSMDPAEKIRLLEEQQKLAKSREEYEAIEQELKDMKLERRFGEQKITVPAEHKQTVEQNYQIERKQAEEELSRLYAEVGAAAERFSNELNALFPQITDLEAKKGKAQLIERVLEEKVTATVELVKLLGGSLQERHENTASARVADRVHREADQVARKIKALAQSKGGNN